MACGEIISALSEWVQLCELAWCWKSNDSDSSAELSDEDDKKIEQV